MALIDKASLLMVPSTYEAGTLYNVLPSGNRAPDSTDQNSGYDQTRADFTFDRGSNAAATRVNADGLIEKYRENLLLQSNQFDTTWTNTSSTETSGFEGYDGTNNAWKIDITATYGQIIQSVSISGVNCTSVYVKAGTLGFVRLRLDASPNAIVDFDLSDGSTAYTSGIVDASSESVGNGWYRISMVSNVSSSTFRIYPLIAANDLTGTSGNIYIQNAQLETGLVATDYLDSGATTAKAGVLIDLPRINYDANGENGALLLEPQRANLVQYSEYFGAWSKATGGTGSNPVLDFGYTSPEGEDNAYKVTFDKGAGTTTSDLSVLQTSFTSGSNTASFYVKADAATRLMVRNSGTWAIYDIGTEWTRIEKTDTGGSLQIGLREGYGLSDVPDSCSVYLYGAQVEASASYPTSYIPNHGTSGGVTRAADSCSVTGVSDVIGQTEGTLFLDLNPLEFADSSRYLSIESSSGAGSGWIGIFAASPNQFRFYGDGFDFNIGGYSVGDRAKIALTYKNGVSTNVYINGVNKGSITANTNSKNYSILKLGYAVIGGVGAGEFNQCTIFPTALTDAECITLTTL